MRVAQARKPPKHQSSESKLWIWNPNSESKSPIVYFRSIRSAALIECFHWKNFQKMFWMNLKGRLLERFIGILCSLAPPNSVSETSKLEVLTGAHPFGPIEKFDKNNKLICSSRKKKLFSDFLNAFRSQLEFLIITAKTTAKSENGKRPMFSMPNFWPLSKAIWLNSDTYGTAS